MTESTQSAVNPVAILWASKTLPKLLKAIQDKEDSSACRARARHWKATLAKENQATRASVIQTSHDWIAAHANGSESLLREYLGLSPEAISRSEESEPVWESLVTDAYNTAISADDDQARDRAIEAMVGNLAKLPPAKRTKWEQRIVKQKLATRRNLDAMLKAADQARQAPAAEAAGETLETHERYITLDGAHHTIELLHDGGRHKRPLCNFTGEILHERAYDDGQEKRRRLVIHGQIRGGGALPECEVDESEFAAMTWVMKHWGVKAVVRAGSSTRDKLREAIQLNSYKCDSQTIYTHTGWRMIDGQRVYLTNAGALGMPGVSVKLAGNLERYSLPTDLAGAPARKAAQASIRMLYAANQTASIPLWSAMYLAPLCEILKPAFSIFVHGQSGSLKSSYVAVALSHFGDFDHKTLPESWETSVNALQRHAFIIKDMPLVIDDFAPQASSSASQQLENSAARLLRSSGNLSSRNRLKADASDNPGTPPRGLIISTGEHLPSGESVIARTLPIEFAKSEGEPITVKKDRLTEAQKNETRELTRYCMAGYILWIRDHWDKLAAELPQRVNERRHKLRGKAHLRTPEMFAQLLTAFDLGIEYAQSVGALTATKAKEFRVAAEKTMTSLSEAQARHISAERPSKLYLDTLQDLFVQGKAYLVGKSEDQDPDRRSEFLGWYDETYLYLLSGPSHRSVVSFCSQAGITFCLKPPSLWKMLESEKILVRGTEGDHITNRVDNQRVVCLVRKLAPIWGPTPD